MPILIFPDLLCLHPVKTSSSRIVIHLLPHAFSRSVSPDVTEISHSFTSAPQKNAAMLSSNTPQTLRKCQWCPYPVGRWFQGTALCLLSLLLIEPRAAALSPPFGKPSSLGLPTCSIKVGSAQQQQEHSATVWSHPKMPSSSSLPKIYLFTKSFFIYEVNPWH